ncbi:MAG: glycosyl hydrolase [Bacteroidetes bacterium]|nr:glycosyl hydrolase [Bacteroidota bacterium]
MSRIKFITLFTILLFLTNDILSQNIDLSKFSDLKYRNIGPYRGGRSLAVCGHSQQPNTFYFGAVGGGIWKTDNSGKSWKCISDTIFKSSSVGAITVAPSDPKIIYVGMGETAIRGNISFGDGIYKSINGGKKWIKLGLENTFAISDIAVHPQNADLVYVSAMGNIFKPNADRGIYKSKDGGKTWQKIFYISDSTGCISLVMDPNDPEILYAGMWQAYRTPWSMSSGGKQSGLYKSTDGGNTWKNISQNEGLPKGILGKICISVSPVSSDRIFAMIENKNGGLFRSDDAGETWIKITEEKAIKQRPWYFSRVFCHPKNKDIVYVLNVAYHKSIDGGKTFTTEWAQHADNHDMWINPENPEMMIIGNDGGGTVSLNGGLNWTEQDFPTGQFYHVAIDNDFPYKIYGAQQDNTSVAIKSRSFSWEISKSDWYICAWGESGYIAPHPFKPKVAYGGNYSGAIYRIDKDLGYTTSLNVYPEDGLGDGVENLKYRFQWTFPIIFSKFSTKEKTILYATSQYVHRSYDEGFHWETISPDLTRNDKSKQKVSGGPITKDNTGVETFNTIFTLAESHLQQGILWAGSDDGLVHLSKDDGKTWTDVSSTQIPENTQISIIEASHYDKQKAYLAANRFKLGDMTPYLFKTEDFGKTWIRIDKGLPKNAATRVIREDPSMKGLLFCGTEIGLYISFNDGASWQKFNQNLPITPIHDIAIHPEEHDLIIATHGRGFWVMDNISILYNFLNSNIQNTKTVFNCRHTFNAGGGSYFDENMQSGVNAPCGLIADYFLPDTTTKEIILKIKNSLGDSVASFSSKRDKNYLPVNINNDFYKPKTVKSQGILSNNKGFNRFVWDMKTADLIKIDGGANVLWGASLSGPMATPDIYTLEFYIENNLIDKDKCEIKPDPRFDKPSIENYKDKKKLLDSVITKVNKIHSTVNNIRNIKKQITNFNSGLPTGAVRDTIEKLGKTIADSLTKIENELVQTQAENIQDLLNFPMKLNNKIAALIDNIDAFKGQVPQQYFDAFADLAAQADVQLQKFDKISKTLIKQYNKKANEIDVDILKVK